MDIQFLGLSYKTAPLDLREKLIFDAEDAAALLEAAGPDLEEGVVLSTCNRTEVYFTSSDPESAGHALEARLAEKAQVETAKFRASLAFRSGEEAVRHLFRVVSGLDALVVGETQITHQVKQAYDLARRSGFARHDLSPLFQAGLAFAGRVRTETELGHHAVSVGSAAVALAEEVLGPIRARTVLLIGAGELAELCLRRLSAAGASPIVVANRSLAPARELASSIGAIAVPFSDILGVLERADVVIGSTSAPHAVLDRLTLEGVMAHRDGRPLFLFDMAVPRDFEPGAREIPGIHLHDIDDLEAFVARGRDGRRQEAQEAERMAAEAARLFVASRRARRAVPLIRRIRERAEEIRGEEVERAIRRMRGLSPRDEEIIRASTSLIVKKILNEPLQALRSMAIKDQTGELLARAAELWGLGAEEAREGLEAGTQEERGSG